LLWKTEMEVVPRSPTQNNNTASIVSLPLQTQQYFFCIWS
jgi:hypothetical protein